MRVIGLMSGTSLDGIDAAVVEFNGDAPDWHVVAFTSIPFSSAQREQIHSAIVHGSAASLCRVHSDLGEWFAAAALQVCEAAQLSPADIDIIGSARRRPARRDPAAGGSGNHRRAHGYSGRQRFPRTRCRGRRRGRAARTMGRSLALFRS